uniref:ATP-dependent helicase Rep n=1 Tax=uncultured prokaryote TaxID=198431 RepID=A0A0H5Q5D7_9ZZZZ|nr:hypothetical protein [uncultured prokaryote]
MENANRSDPSFAAVPTAHARGYIFTHFNYSDEIEAALLKCGADYGCYGRESCPTTARLHLQGFLFFKNKKKGSALIKQFPGASWRVARADAQDNYKYCSKSGDVVEWGDRPMNQADKGAAGKKCSMERWRKLQSLAEAGDFKAIRQEFPDIWWNQKAKVMEHYMDFKSDAVPLERDGEMPGVWIVGPAGSGKSSSARDMAFEHFGEADPFVKPCNNVWWTKYKFQDTVILDDFDPTCTKELTHEFKTWIDRYATLVRVHHGMIRINPVNFVVTSQYEIKDCFTDPEVVAAMERRFPRVIRMSKQDGDEIRIEKKRKYALDDPTEVFGL